MDRKTIIALLAGFGLLALWMWGVGKLYPPVPRPAATNIVASATNGAGSTNLPAQLSAGTNTGVAGVPAPTAIPTVASNAPEQTVTIETPEAIFTFTSHGGGIKNVRLKHFTDTTRRSASTNAELVMLNEHGRAPILSMQADGIFGDNVFALRKTDTNTVIAEKALAGGLRVVKQFEPTSNYTVRAQVWLQNTGDAPLTIPAQSMAIGSAAPAAPEEDPMWSGVFWFNGEKAEHIQAGWFDNRAMGCFWSRPRAEYDSGMNAVHWGAVHNQFFTTVVIPSTNAFGAQFKAWRYPVPRPGSTKGETANAFEGVTMLPAAAVPANGFLERQFTIYMGPKQEKTLTRLGRQTDEIMDFGFFSPISKLFLRTMNFLHRFMPYGVAIIVITILIKLIFWPLTQASTRSMKRMQALQPEIKKLQEKYKDDPAKQQKKMMELWREHKVNPMSGCWPMLVQLPIFFALFRMIPNAIELRGTPFLWIHDLSRPDTIFQIPGVDLPFNPLPLIMGVTMFWQAKLTPASPGMDPAQQRMMKYMPLIFLVFLYNQPSGLTLYWTIQNLLTILQTKLTNAKEPAPAPAPAPVMPAKKKK